MQSRTETQRSKSRSRSSSRRTRGRSRSPSLRREYSRSRSPSLRREYSRSKSPFRSRSPQERVRSKSKSLSRPRQLRSRSLSIGAKDRSTPYLPISKEDKEELAEEIARRVFALKEEKEEREKEDAIRKKVWEVGSEFLVYKICSHFKDQQNLPQEILRFKKRNVGMIVRYRENGEKIPENEIRRRMKDHNDGNFHLWCMRKYEEEDKMKRTFEEENHEVGVLVIKAFL